MLLTNYAQIIPVRRVGTVESAKGADGAAAKKRDFDQAKLRRKSGSSPERHEESAIPG
jgi:antitoxin (DNA-binding transcriptional repressor) of toxin-antitoxin stability system